MNNPWPRAVASVASSLACVGMAWTEPVVAVLTVFALPSCIYLIWRGA
jgi:hypothetical protein